MRVRNVFLLTKAYDQSLIALTREVAQWLLSKESGSDYAVYVEHTMKDNKVFDADGLTKDNATYKERLRYWGNEICRNEPHTFDIIVAVRPSLPYIYEARG